MAELEQGSETKLTPIEKLERARQVVAQEDESLNIAIADVRRAEKMVAQATTQRSMANRALTTALERVDGLAKDEFEQSIIDLLGFNSLSLEDGQSTVINVDANALARYHELYEAEEARKEKFQVEKDVARFGYSRQSEDKFTPLHIILLKSLPQLTPGTPFYGASESSVNFVAGEPSEQSPATVIANVRKTRNKFNWDIGLSIPVVGQDEPYLALSRSLHFDIDSLIEDKLESFKMILKTPDSSYPFETMNLEGVLAKFGKSDEVKELEAITNQLLAGVVRGDETRNPNGTVRKPEYSFARYKEYIEALQERDSELYETSLNERALRLAREQTNAHRDHSVYISVSVDHARFALAEHATRVADDKIPEDLWKVDIVADFLKKGLQLQYAERAELQKNR